MSEKSVLFLSTKGKKIGQSLMVELFIFIESRLGFLNTNDGK